LEKKEQVKELDIGDKGLEGNLDLDLSDFKNLEELYC